MSVHTKLQDSKGKVGLCQEAGGAAAFSPLMLQTRLSRVPLGSNGIALGRWSSVGDTAGDEGA
jgi:hypothetical protein